MATTIEARQAAVTLVASTSNAAAASKRGATDMRTCHGGLLTARITNGGTGPTDPCSLIVSVAMNDGSTPSTGAIGVDWRKLYEFAATNTANAVAEWTLDIPMCQHVQVEFSGNTAQAVTVEALMTKYLPPEGVS